MILFDTNIISEVVRAKAPARPMRAVSALMERSVYTTSITVAELLTGVALLPAGRRRRELSDTTAGVLADFFGDRVLAFDEAAAVEYSVIIAQRSARGRRIDLMDAQIAAIARCHRATLVTRNVRDFAGCGIEVVNPWE